MYQKIKAKFKANPTIFYACSIVASWAGVGSLMNFRTLAIKTSVCVLWGARTAWTALFRMMTVTAPCAGIW